MSRPAGLQTPQVFLSPACCSIAWCRDSARPLCTFSCCSSMPQRSVKVNAENFFWYPDYSGNMFNTNQIERKSFKITLNSLDAYKRLEDLSPSLRELCALPLWEG